jgi:hypothetical protein
MRRQRNERVNRPVTVAVLREEDRPMAFPVLRPNINPALLYGGAGSGPLLTAARSGSAHDSTEVYKRPVWGVIKA